MTIQENVDLADYSTMALGGKASFLAHISNKDELLDAINFAKDKNLEVIMVGSGSNIVWRDEGYQGLVLISDIKGLKIAWQNETEAQITIGSGEVWDEVVAKCVSEGLSGIEALSLIPGTAGATPVQNVGAYGQEIADAFVSLEAYDTQKNEFVSIPKQDCHFGYRTSRFKTIDHGRFCIINISLHLVKKNPQPPFYGALAKYLDAHSITAYTPKVLRNAVIDIRSHKLPDPKEVHNNGSFFANPIVSLDHYLELRQVYPNIPSWPAGENQVKIPAAWLLEQAGFKDYKDQDTGMATWPSQPLVLVNETAGSTKDLLSFRDKIIQVIKKQFDIVLTQEPELLPLSKDD